MDLYPDFITVIDRHEVEDEFGRTVEGGETVRFSSKCAVEKWSTYKILSSGGSLQDKPRATIHIKPSHNVDLYAIKQRQKVKIQERTKKKRIAVREGTIIDIDHEHEVLEVEITSGPEYRSETYFMNTGEFLGE